MRGEQLARQWRILRTIESRNHGATVAELAQQEVCRTRTIWRDLAAIQEAGFPLYSEKDGQKSRFSFVDGYTFHLPLPLEDWSYSHGRWIWKIRRCKAQRAAAQESSHTR